MEITKEEAEKRFPLAKFGGYCIIKGEAVIGVRAVIGTGAVIGEGAVIATLCTKYVGNIIPYENRVLIRIGCEIHNSDEWERDQVSIAEKYGELKWWKLTGRRMLEFLKKECQLYIERQGKN